MLFGRDKQRMVGPDEALPGRDHRPFAVPARHEVLGTPLEPPFPEGFRRLIVGMGCFWGAERLFWETEGVYTTAVGYAGGYTPNPTYEEVCTGLTGHAEVVLVVFDPAVVSDEQLLRVIWEGHDQTQGMRQGNDVGTQYRSCILVVDEGRRSGRSPRPAATPTSGNWRPRATATSPPRSSTPGSSSTPRTTTSSTWRRTPSATAGSAARASAARSASPADDRQTTFSGATVPPVARTSSPGAIGKTSRGVPAAAQTTSKRSRSSSTAVGSRRSWPNGGTPPIG